VILRDLEALMRIPGLSGHEGRVAAEISARMPVPCRTDRMGNLIATFPGDEPSVMLFAHMDQIGFIVRRIGDDGLIRVHRMGGVPERALPSQAVVLSTRDGRDIPGVLASKGHHATTPEEKYSVPRVADIFIDTGHDCRKALEEEGITIGTPVTYAPDFLRLAGGHVAGTALDDRAGCAVLLDVARGLSTRGRGPLVHLVFSTQEEFNLRGAMAAARALEPAIAIQIDLMLACDTPDMAGLGDMALGYGPGMSLYSFHGRGTLNGVLPHPSLVGLFEDTADDENIPLQRSAQIGVLTDLSYAQHAGEGVAAIDLGFPMRYSHSSLEVCHIGDLERLSHLLRAGIARVGPEFPLKRWS